MAITAAMVKELRDKTGAGMMDCKKALTECEADVEKALDWLRQKGLSKAAKRADRATSEGVIASATSADGKVSAIVEVMTETDFVARGEKFQDFAKHVAQEVAANNPENLDAFQDSMNELAASTGEKTVLGRFVRMSIEGEGVIGTYVHSNGKLAVLVEVDTDKPADATVAEFAKNVAMQIAASNPLALDADSLDPGAARTRTRSVPPESSCRRQARKDHRQDRRRRREEVLQGSVPARSALHPRRQDDRAGSAEGHRQGRRLLHRHQQVRPHPARRVILPSDATFLEKSRQ